VAVEPFLDLIHKLRGELLSEMPPAKVVLSVGCAGSWYFQWFNEKFPHRVDRHVGFDTLPPPSDLPTEVEWHQGSMADMSTVPDSSIDLIFAGQAIEHVPVTECSSFLQHAYRILKPQGWLVMDSPNFSITGPWPFPNPEHVIEYTPKQMRVILKTAGFHVMHCKGILLCKETGKLLDDPYNYERVNYRRIKEAKERPEESFIWWIQATRSGRFDTNRLARLLTTINRSYERERARFAKREERAPQKRAAVTGASRFHLGQAFRQVLRRLIPRRVRWLARAAFKRITGLYYRDIMRQQRDFTERLEAIQHQVTVALPARVDAQGEVMDLLLRRLRMLEEEVAALGQPLQRLEETQRALRSDLSDRLAELQNTVRLVAPLALAANMYWTLSPEAALGENELVMSRSFSNFYVQFQDRHRGSEDLIRERQRGRVAYFASCQRVLDIGCGRGEFLELLREQLIPAEGIDVNASAVEICRQKGLTAHQAEALAYLSTEEAGAFAGIHMSHVLEHVPFPTAIQLLEACADRLQPGGVLIAETPNPHCPEALQAFFLDPTHIRPLFPEALIILLESLGFEQVQVHFLSPLREEKSDAPQRGPQDFADYLVVALKPPTKRLTTSSEEKARPSKRLSQRGTAAERV